VVIKPSAERPVQPSSDWPQLVAVAVANEAEVEGFWFTKGQIPMEWMDLEAESLSGYPSNVFMSIISTSISTNRAF
jgi:hypothetical protein